MKRISVKCHDLGGLALPADAGAPTTYSSRSVRHAKVRAPTPIADVVSARAGRSPAAGSLWRNGSVVMTAAIAASDTGTATDRRAGHNILPCFGCNLTFSYKGTQGDISGRFCSMRCQAWFDAGNTPPNSPDDTLIGWRLAAEAPGIEAGSDFYAAVFGRYPVAMKRSSDGFKIACFGCGSQFESRGLRCCSDACERRYRERQDNLAVMAQVGIEPTLKRKCVNPACANTIPKWRKGRQVSKSVRFCSPKCSRKAKTRST